MARIIQAESVGCKVPTDAVSVTIHSVFHTAANLRVDRLDYLLTLFVAQNIELPQGIRLPEEAEALFPKLRVGQTLLCQQGRLHGMGVEIDLRQARNYDGAMIRVAKDLWSVEALSAWQTARDLLARTQEEKGASLRITDVHAKELPSASPQVDTAQGLSALVLALQTLDSDLAAKAVRQLVGLGSGLTPTGDDVLVGLLAAIWAQQEVDRRRGVWVRALTAAVKEQSLRTNDISRSYLMLAVEGQFSSSLVHLAAAICAGGTPEMVRTAAEAAFQTGHTSGLDAATGLLAGLAAWNET